MQPRYSKDVILRAFIEGGITVGVFMQYVPVTIQSMMQPNRLLNLAVRYGLDWEQGFALQEKACRIQCRHVLQAVRAAKKRGQSFSRRDLLQVIYAARHAAPEYVPVGMWPLVGASRPKAVRSAMVAA
jgi:hypothetical protein